MPEPTSTRFPPLTHELRRIGSDVTEMLAVRRELAEVELRRDLASARRLAVVGGGSAVAVLTSLPLLLTALALQLDSRWQLTAAAWALLFAVVLLLGGSLAVWIAARRFRRDFVGLQDSIAELKEDVVWLREWVEDQTAAGQADRED